MNTITKMNLFCVIVLSSGLLLSSTVMARGEVNAGGLRNTGDLGNNARWDANRDLRNNNLNGVNNSSLTVCDEDGDCWD